MVSLANKLVIFFIFAKIAVIFADDLKEDNNNIDRGSRITPGTADTRGGLWFGPRLGKRASWVTNDDDDDSRQTFLHLLEAADALRYYYDQLSLDKYDSEREAKSDGKGNYNKVSKKIILTPKLGRSVEKYENVDFTPRLGRRRTDGMVAAEQEQYRQDPDLDSRRFFSPRLGRTSNTMNFSPRLGREIAYGRIVS